jgi:hypothetical protein
MKFGVLIAAAMAALGLLAASATTVSAASIFVSENASLQQGGGQVSGTFNVAPDLTGAGGVHYRVTSATITAAASANPQYTLTGNTDTGYFLTGQYEFVACSHIYGAEACAVSPPPGYPCSGCEAGNVLYVGNDNGSVVVVYDYSSRYFSDQYTSAGPSTLELLAGSSSSTATDSSYVSYTNYFPNYFGTLLYNGPYQPAEYLVVYGANAVYDSASYTGYQGAINLTDTLLPADIHTLNSTGELGFNALATQGALSLQSVSLDFTLSAVPEPATWAMMLLGLFGLGAVLRRRAQSETMLAA